MLQRFFKPINVNNQYLKYRLPSLISEIYLIQWFPNSRTNIHYHDGKQCHFIILNSTLNEKRYQNDSITNNVLQSFKIYSINDDIGAHSMTNNDNEIKWSLHRYR